MLSDIRTGERREKRGGKALLYLHRSEILLRLGGMRGARTGPTDDQLGRGRPRADGQDDMPCGHPFAEGVRDLRPRTAVRGGGAREGGQRPAAPESPGTLLYQQLLARSGTEARPGPGAGLHRRASPDGAVHGPQHLHLQHLYEVHRAGGYLCLLGGRGVSGCDVLSGGERRHGPRTGRDADP